MKNVIIYTTNYCPFCHRAKALLTSLEVPYQDIDVTSDDKLREEVSEKYHWQTVPMIVIGDEFIGGFDDINKLHQAGRLMAKLEN